VTDRRATATPEKLDSILRTIQNLQGRIEDDRLEEGPEKDRMREHMERLINDYRVTEDDLNTANAEAGRAPISVPGVRRFRAFRYGTGYGTVYRSLLGYCISHAQCRGVVDYEYEDDGTMWVVAVVVGYEQDARYAESLYTEARAYFANRMEPTVLTRLSDAENVYRLRSAGIERGRIGEMMGWGDKAHMRVTKVYKEECLRRGEPAVMTGKGNSMKTFREAFSMAFPNTLWDRLYNARMAAAAGGAIELKGRKEAVDEEFYTQYPQMRPKPVRVSKEPVKPLKVDNRRKAWTAKDQAEWERLNASVAGRMGQNAGAAAAREVNVKGGNATESLED
jgi:hypothetical protein